MSKIELTISPDKLDAIVYGDMPLKYKETISFEDPIINYFFCTGLIKKYFQNPPPKNSSEQTYNELIYNKKLNNLATEDYVQFALNTDLQESKFYSNFSNEVLNLNLNEIYFNNLLKQVEPILFLIKQKFNRPRPYQIMSYFNVQIPQKIAYSHDHPSYPSGHALDAYVVAYVLSKKVPNQKNKIYNFCDTIINSRMMINAHYLSDILCSKQLAEDIITHNLLKNI